MPQYAVTKIPTSTTVVTLLTAGFEQGDYVVIQNAAATRLYIKFGPAATADDYSFFLEPGIIFENHVPLMKGTVITGIWSGADPTGAARVTIGGR